MPGRMAACGWIRNFSSKWMACARTRYAWRAVTLLQTRTAIHNERAFNNDRLVALVGSIRAGRVSRIQPGDGVAVCGVVRIAGKERARGMAGASAASAGASGVDERSGRGVRTVADRAFERLGANCSGGRPAGGRRHEIGQLAASTLGKLDRNARWI